MKDWKLIKKTIEDDLQKSGRDLADIASQTYSALLSKLDSDKPDPSVGTTDAFLVAYAVYLELLKEETEEEELGWFINASREEAGCIHIYECLAYLIKTDLCFPESAIEKFIPHLREAPVFFDDKNTTYVDLLIGYVATFTAPFNTQSTFDDFYSVYQKEIHYQHVETLLFDLCVITLCKQNASESWSAADIYEHITTSSLKVYDTVREIFDGKKTSEEIQKAFKEIVVSEKLQRQKAIEQRQIKQAESLKEAEKEKIFVSQRNSTDSEKLFPTITLEDKKTFPKKIDIDKTLLPLIAYRMISTDLDSIHPATLYFYTKDLIKKEDISVLKVQNNLEKHAQSERSLLENEQKKEIKQLEETQKNELEKPGLTLQQKKILEDKFLSDREAKHREQEANRAKLKEEHDRKIKRQEDESKKEEHLALSQLFLEENKDYLKIQQEKDIQFKDTAYLTFFTGIYLSNVITTKQNSPKEIDTAKNALLFLQNNKYKKFGKNASGKDICETACLILYQKTDFTNLVKIFDILCDSDLTSENKNYIPWDTHTKLIQDCLAACDIIPDINGNIPTPTWLSHQTQKHIKLIAETTSLAKESQHNPSVLYMSLKNCNKATAIINDYIKTIGKPLSNMLKPKQRKSLASKDPISDAKKSIDAIFSLLKTECFLELSSQEEIVEIFKPLFKYKKIKKDFFGFMVNLTSTISLDDEQNKNSTLLKEHFISVVKDNLENIKVHKKIYPFISRKILKKPRTDQAPKEKSMKRSNSSATHLDDEEESSLLSTQDIFHTLPDETTTLLSPKKEIRKPIEGTSLLLEKAEVNKIKQEFPYMNPPKKTTLSFYSTKDVAKFINWLRLMGATITTGPSLLSCITQNPRKVYILLPLSPTEFQQYQNILKNKNTIIAINACIENGGIKPSVSCFTLFNWCSRNEIAIEYLKEFKILLAKEGHILNPYDHIKSVPFEYKELLRSCIKTKENPNVIAPPQIVLQKNNLN